jgi:outer membrane immunogenic protein
MQKSIKANKAAVLAAAVSSLFVSQTATAGDANWAGVHAGIHIAEGWGDSQSVRLDASNFFPAGFVTDRSYRGTLGGFHLGYDWQFGKFVAGVEGDLSFGKLSGSKDVVSPLIGNRVTQSSHELEKFSTVTGRLGYAHNNWLFYGRGGLAWTTLSVSGPLVNTVNGAVINTNLAEEKRMGWTIGAGTEWALAKNVALRAEYNYMNFGSGEVTSFSTPAGGGAVTSSRSDIDIAAHVVKLGATIRFGN